MNIHLENDIVIISIATPEHIFYTELIVTQQSEVVYPIGIRANIVKVSVDIATGYILGIAIKIFIKRAIGGAVVNCDGFNAGIA